MVDRWNNDKRHKLSEAIESKKKKKTELRMMAMTKAGQIQN